MWHRTAGTIAVGLTLSVVQASRGEQAHSANHLIANAGWVTFEVAMGRIQATGSRASQNQRRLTKTHPSGATESMSVAVNEGRISFRYAWMGAGEQRTIRVSGSNDVEIRRIGLAGDDIAASVQFRQPSHGPLTLAVQQGNAPPNEVHGRSLWHLLIEHPDLCVEHLVPLLAALKPDWQITADVAAIRATLLDTARRPPRIGREEVRALVTQIGCHEFHLRRNAIRRLRALGPVVLNYLDEYGPNELDREQRAQVAHLRTVVTRRAGDSPHTVARWLQHDSAIWLALMSDDDPHCRAVAARQLARICDRPIDFDPDAPPHEREDRIASLRVQLRR